MDGIQPWRMGSVLVAASVNGTWHLLLVNTVNGGWQVSRVTCAQDG
jgi:hypothetical protein